MNEKIHKMITNSREKGIEAKQEGETNENKKFTKAPATSSRQWSAFRNPRIVRVSRSFGGKDRHSKVCTVRGLRDRRIRLSVPTAIQLYDLQDKLGLSQPSKVIDWLIDATKNDIDKLPPLQLPQGFGHQFHQQMFFSNESLNSSSSNSSHFSPFFDTNSSFINKDNIGFHSLGIRVNNNSSNLGGGGDQNVTMAKARYWEGGESSNVNDKGKWIKIHDQENQAQKLFPLVSSSTHNNNSSSLPNMFNNPISYNNYNNYHWDASNLSLSQFGANNNNTNSQSHHGFTPQNENSQFFLCPPANIPSYFSQYPSYNFSSSSMANNESTRETNHFQWLTSSSSGANNPLKNFSLNVNPGLSHHSQRNDNGSHPDHKDES